MSYRMNADLEVEKIYNKLKKVSERFLFRLVPDNPNFSYAYCEEEMYLIRNNCNGQLYISFGRSPVKALNNIMQTEDEEWENTRR